eukprot:s685_g7.t1
MRSGLLISQLFPLLLSWSIAEGSCTDAAELASCKPADLHYQQDEEEDSDDTTLLAMPQRPTRRAAAPRRSGEAAVRSSDATSLFQVEEVISGPVVGLVKPEGRDHEQALSEPRPLQTPTAGPSGLAAIYVDMGEEKTRPETWFLVATVALVLVVLLAWACLFQNGKESAQGLAFNPELGRQVMRLPIRSAEEILQKFAPASPAAADSNQNSGMLVRLEGPGRVVAKSAQIMGTPFSERQCVMYSASASHKRQDGVHQPPLAYHAACSDFTLELEHPDGPLQITVHGHDVLLFEMSQGRFSREAAFSEVPEAWRGFALAHLIHGADASCNAMSCVDLGTKGALEFCESALLDGSRVTCVGEVVRDRNGSLSLCPWRPPVVGLDSPQQPRSRVESLTAAFFGKPRFSTTTWESPGRSTSALAGQVLISDGADFIDNSFSLWRRLTRGPNWCSASLLVS